MNKELECCTICPHNCKINRTKNPGRCKSTDKIKIALYSIHNFEEPCISGEKGSGTIFFSNCNMNCVFCQNYEISQLGRGKEITIEELANVMIKQQERNVQNINLVTPTSYALHIVEAIKIARKKGLEIPIVYYYDDLAKKYSKVDNYFEIATKAIQEMYRQVGTPVLDENGVMKKGLMIRHLILPNEVQNSKKVLKWIKENIDSNVYVSIMAQYFPTYKAKEIPEIARKITKEEYEKVENYLYELDLENGYIQELGEHEEEYVPTWEY